MASGATCVQRLDGSRDSAIHTKYRISLRSSSMREPRYPLPRVVLTYKTEYDAHPDRTPSLGRGVNANSLGVPWRGLRRGSFVRPRRLQPCIDGRCVGCNPPDRRGVRGTGPRCPRCFSRVRRSFCWAGFENDPSAGSPTETLLRLLLPLNDKVQWTSRDVAGSEPPTSPRSEHFTGPFNR